MAQRSGDEPGVAPLYDPFGMSCAEGLHVMLGIPFGARYGNFLRFPCHSIQIEHRAVALTRYRPCQGGLSRTRISDDRDSHVQDDARESGQTALSV